ncbi:VWA domain-containing protein [Balneolaceae bacterium ANBcel3]|nr:VWA domain-containing protein [Balneolaceae bacterium ANBcel3]
MIWDNVLYLWLLLLIPVMYGINRVAGDYIRQRRKRFFSDGLFRHLFSERWDKAFRWKEYLFYAGFFFMVVALAGPKIGTEVREVRREQLDILVALDLSLSMKAEDVRPNRLEKAKFEIHRMLDHLRNDRVGLIIFTGQAMLHCPLTNDYSAVRMFLDIAEPDIMPSTTTDFAPMFREAVNAFTSSIRSYENQPESRVPARILLVFSDGEDHFDRYAAAYQDLQDLDVYVFTVGIGTEEGGTIPRFNPETGELDDFHRDRQGQVVTTRLHPGVLRELAENSGGQYYEISRTAHNIEGFIRQLQHLERTTFAREEITRYQNKYSFPAFLGLLCFIAVLLIPGYRKTGTK